MADHCPPRHGGPDAQGVPLHDFSTNSNACGPCPETQAAVQQADATRYPDPAYTALRAQLGAFHGVAPGRIVVAGSASEFIHRATAWAGQQVRQVPPGLQGTGLVVVPQHAYGDYADAAQAQGLAIQRRAGAPHHPMHAPTGGDAGAAAKAVAQSATLEWACEPGSPLGQSDPALAAWRRAAPPQGLRVLDCAYAPLRLENERWAGRPAATLPPGCWQLWTPNKALGLTGVRAAYAVAPPHSEALVNALNARAPSWPVGAHGVALLQSWVQPSVQQWLVHSLGILSDWKARQHRLCLDMGWAVHGGSLANYFAAQPPGNSLAMAGQRLRSAGIKLRECTSFDLPGHVRLGVLPPASQAALLHAWRALSTKDSS